MSDYDGLWMWSLSVTSPSTLPGATLSRLLGCWKQRGNAMQHLRQNFPRLSRQSCDKWLHGLVQLFVTHALVMRKLYETANHFFIEN